MRRVTLAVAVSGFVDDARIERRGLHVGRDKEGDQIAVRLDKPDGIENFNVNVHLRVLFAAASDLMRDARDTSHDYPPAACCIAYCNDSLLFGDVSLCA
jgi:hypothetical protein